MNGTPLGVTLVLLCTQTSTIQERAAHWMLNLRDVLQGLIPEPFSVIQGLSYVFDT